MTTHATIEHLGKYIGQTVELRGWLYNKRVTKKVRFLQVRDGSGIVQAIVGQGDVDEGRIDAALFDLAADLPQESSIRISGLVVADARSKIGVELQVRSLELVHRPTEEYPITPKEHGVDFLLKRRHLWVRSQKQWATLRIRHTVIKAIRDYLDDQGFISFDAPIFTPNACEGTTTLFGVEYFDTEAYLSQSGQLYQEAGAMALGKVYCFGPAFRAEKSKTRKHLTEFWMVEPEIAFGDMEDALKLAEGLMAAIARRTLADRRPELEILERDIPALEALTAPFPRMTYDEAIAKLQGLGHEIEWGADFGAPDEAALTDHSDQPLVITGFPTQIKAFYMMPDPERPEIVKGFDILGPRATGELVGGGQRSHDLAYLEQQIEAHGLPAEAFEWYLDLRRFGSVPHSGFGIGLERTIAWVSGTHHIRETIPFPRMITHINP